MQAFALTVIDFDGTKIGELQQQLQEQGYTVTTVSLLESDPPASTKPVDVEVIAGGGDATSPDNSLPFKCPACGRTFDEQVVCAEQHEPTETVPTGEVIGPAGAAAATDPAAASTTADPPAVVDTPAPAPETAPPAPATASSSGDGSAAPPADAGTTATDPATADTAATADPSAPSWPQ